MKNFIIIFIFFLIFCQSLQLSAFDIRHTVGGHYAAINESFLDKALEYSAANNEKKLKKLLETCIVIKLKPNQDVRIIDEKVEQKKIKIRLVAPNIELWTVAGATKVKPKKTQKEFKKKALPKLDLD